MARYIQEIQGDFTTRCKRRQIEIYSSKNLLHTVQIKGVTVEKIPRNIIKANMDP